MNDDKTIVYSPEDMPSGKLCSSCGVVARDLPDGAAFCPNCGAPFAKFRDFGPGTVIGGLLGILVGAASGAVAGSTVGKLLDENIVRLYRCELCGHTWRT